MNRIDRKIEEQLKRLRIELEDVSADAMANLEEEVVAFRKKITEKALKLADVKLSAPHKAGRGV